jgi:hypothetical protein
VFDTARRPDGLIAAKHDKRPEAFVPRPLGVLKTEFNRMLRGEEWHNVVTRHIRSEVDYEMSQIVFLARADGTVREKHERPSPHESANRVVGVDPRITPRGCVKFGTRRP